jgi:antitoxin component YwqK of YwqJK toxin-antitoxin module
MNLGQYHPRALMIAQQRGVCCSKPCTDHESKTYRENMCRDTFYHSSIPPEATARPIGKYRNGRPKRIEYYIGKELVGVRCFAHTGDIENERSYRNGEIHGWEYRWDAPSELVWSADYVEESENETTRQSIPEEAIARVYQTYRNGRPKWIHYYVGEELVGKRYFNPDGEIGMELAYSDIAMRGENDQLDSRSKLISATPFYDGFEHGTAYQWAKDGRLIGTYTMEHGTGTDLWWNELMNCDVILAEARQIVKSLWHGYEWWFYSIQPSQMWIEKQWFAGNLHGIEREWNLKARLSRGWPKYWIHGKQVDKRKYLRAAAKDPTLPAFRPENNHPRREFPPEVAQHLK